MKIPQLALGLLGASALAANHGHMHTHGHHRMAGTPQIAARDGGNPPFAVDIINNTPNNNVHVYMITDYEGDHALITSETLFFSPVDSVQGKAMMSPQVANKGLQLGAQGSVKRFDSLPIKLLSARIVVSLGPLNVTGDLNQLSMPDFLGTSAEGNTSWWFMEANLPDTCMYANPTFVDFAGLTLDFDLDIPGKTFSYTGLGSDGIDQACQQLAAEQAKDNQPWSDLCMQDGDGKNLRIKSPSHCDGFDKYWDDYIDQVWQHYSTTSLTFLLNGESTAECRTDVSKQVMTCNGTSAEFAKPGSSDTWGCVGNTTFRHSDPRLNCLGPAFCAAFHRGTLLIPGGEVQPSLKSDEYYPLDQTHNKYARIMHELQANHTGYAFPYDDVTAPGDEDVSGLLVGDEPSCLRIYVGGRDAGQDGAVGGESPVVSGSASASATGSGSSTNTADTSFESMTIAASSTPSTTSTTISSSTTSSEPTTSTSSPAPTSTSAFSSSILSATTSSGSPPVTSTTSIPRPSIQAAQAPYSPLTALSWPAKQAGGDAAVQDENVLTDWVTVTQVATVTEFVRMAKRTDGT